MKVPQYAMIGIRNMRIYTVRNMRIYTAPNDKVKDGNRFGGGIITHEQIRLVYADITGVIDEIERVHPKVCLEVRTGIIVNGAKLITEKSEDNIAKNKGSEDIEEIMVELRAYRYNEYEKDTRKEPSIPCYFKLIGESFYNVYQCKHTTHSPNFECGPWSGSVACIWEIKTEFDKEGEMRKKKLEEICGFK